MSRKKTYVADYDGLKRIERVAYRTSMDFYNHLSPRTQIVDDKIKIVYKYLKWKEGSSCELSRIGIDKPSVIETFLMINPKNMTISFEDVKILGAARRIERAILSDLGDKYKIKSHSNGTKR